MNQNLLDWNPFQQQLWGARINVFNTQVCLYSTVNPCFWRICDDAGNTALVFHNKKLLALDERDRPCMSDPPPSNQFFYIWDKIGTMKFSMCCRRISPVSRLIFRIIQKNPEIIYINYIKNIMWASSSVRIKLKICYKLLHRYEGVRDSSSLNVKLLLQIWGSIYESADSIKVLENGDLETVGIEDYGQKLKHPFTAHPKIDPVTGTGSPSTKLICFLPFHNLESYKFSEQIDFY